VGIGGWNHGDRSGVSARDTRNLRRQGLLWITAMMDITMRRWSPALRFPHPFYVVAALILFLGITASIKMPTDIFPEIAGSLIGVVHAPAVDTLESRLVQPFLIHEIPGRLPRPCSVRLHCVSPCCRFTPYGKKITAWPLRPGSLTTAPRHFPVAKSKATTSSWVTQ
jgi:hypothetical protein